MYKTTENEIKNKEDEQKRKVVSLTLGKTTANVIITSCVGIFGDEWNTRIDKETGLDEKAYLEQCWSEYYYATGKTDLPPSMIVIAGMTAYVAPRLTMPKTQKRTASILEKIKIWYKARKLKQEYDNIENKKESSKDKELKK
jgi:hypothetical protein